MAVLLGKIFLVLMLSQVMVCADAIQARAQTQGSAGGYSIGDDLKRQCEDKALKDRLKKYLDAGLHEFTLEICSILLAQREFGKISSALFRKRIAWIEQHRSNRNMKIPVSEKTKKHLVKTREYLQFAIKGFGIKKKGVVKIPRSLLGQLRKADALLAAFESGAHWADSAYGYDVDMVRQRMNLALKYSLVWAKEGFK